MAFLFCSWYVDDTPVRTLESSAPGYPQSPMKVFFSIWDASQWATGPSNARIPVDYSFAVSALSLFATARSLAGADYLPCPCSPLLCISRTSSSPQRLADSGLLSFS